MTENRLGVSPIIVFMGCYSQKQGAGGGFGQGLAGIVDEVFQHFIEKQVRSLDIAKLIKAQKQRC